MKRTMTGRIFLVGFMGAGKTTIGRLLAERIGWEFVDLDAEIEKREGQSIREIFSLRGEDSFRIVESDCLRAAAGSSEAVVSLGGGAYVSPENRLLVDSLGVVVYLSAPFEILVERIGDDPVRPLASDRDRLAQLFEERVDSYRHAAVTIETVNRTPEDVVAEILRVVEG